MNQKYNLFATAVAIFIALVALIVGIMAYSLASTPPPASLSSIPTVAPSFPTALNQPPGGFAQRTVALQRLNVTYHGQDGSKIIGSGCPGTDYQGQQNNIHFTVSGIDASKQVNRVVVAGDHSTLTWEKPCQSAWALEAIQNGGQWDVYIAPSDPTEIYTLLFFYTDNSMALGMVSTVK